MERKNTIGFDISLYDALEESGLMGEVEHNARNNLKAVFTGAHTYGENMTEMGIRLLLDWEKFIAGATSVMIRAGIWLSPYKSDCVFDSACIARTAAVYPNYKDCDSLGH
ncbi:hypothetical protein QJS10_CPA03g00722 [Acorus calamus]|uniref:Uncharacterized protein n=1 Tax=Acorus calamus TaxID=4465 RepID=A0AAV9F458_ACOCL|nr:hypothetical protein QJS10_CPA03g00722 [Acorus calamus]